MLRRNVAISFVVIFILVQGDPIETEIIFSFVIFVCCKL